MSRENAPEAPHGRLYVWLPAFVLKLLVFSAFAFVIVQATAGLGERELDAHRTWIVIASLFGLLLFLGIDRVTSLRVSPGGLEATLAEVKARALEEVEALEDPELAEALESQILRSESPDQVQAAAELATELNVGRAMKRIRRGIRERRQAYVRYRIEPEGTVETYRVAPLDIKPGRTQASRVNDYLWVHSYDHDRVISLRLGRVLSVELSEETFDPAELMADWKEGERDWNVPRDW